MYCSAFDSGKIIKTSLLNSLQGILILIKGFCKECNASTYLFSVCRYLPICWMHCRWIAPTWRHWQDQCWRSGSAWGKKNYL